MYAYSENNHENFNRPVFASIDHLRNIVQSCTYRLIQGAVPTYLAWYNAYFEIKSAIFLTCLQHIINIKSIYSVVRKNCGKLKIQVNFLKTNYNSAQNYQIRTKIITDL